MSKFVGIDIRPNVIRVAVVRSSYRRLHVEELREVDTSAFEEVEHAVRHAASEFTRHGEQIAFSIGGESAYIHRLALPPAALKQVEEVVPFELEARIPVEFDELVYDSRVLPRARHDAAVEVLAAAAPIALVRERIELGAAAFGHQPEQISVAPLALGNLASVLGALRGDECVAIVELGDETCEVAIVHQGAAVFARTLSVGVGGFPESAPELVRALRQTFVAWAAVGQGQIARTMVCGGGAETPGIFEYLGEHVGVAVEPLPELELEASPSQRDVLPRFARALGVSLALRAGTKDLNLRRGPLLYQRGYGFLKEKVPLLVGLSGAMLLSFVFSAWAESRALSHENASLGAAMAGLSEQILDEESHDPERVLELLDNGLRVEKDPQPEIDGFELALRLAKHIPLDFEHQVDELDLARNHVKLRGIVKSTDAAQKIAENLKTEACFKDVKISKIAQHRKTTRQSYSMEFDIRCEEPPKKRSAAAEGESE